MHFWPIPNFLWLGEYKSFFKIQIFPLLSSQMSRIICHKSLRPNNSGIYLKVEVWYQIIYVLVKQIYKHGVFPCTVVQFGEKILIRCPLMKLISSRQQTYPNFTKSTKLAPISRLKKWIFARIFKIYKIDGLILKKAVIYDCSPKLWPLSSGVKLMSLYLKRWKTLKISLYVKR